MPQKQYLGGVSATRLSADMTNVATSFTVTSGGGTGFPTGGSYPFVVVVDRGNPGEELILCTSRSGDTFTVTTRGYDGTTAVAHTGNPSVEHCIDAGVINESSAHVYGTSATHTAASISNTAAGNIAATDVQAALNELDTEKIAKAIGTTAGDTIYWSASATPVRLAKGTDGQVLTLASGLPSWATAAAGSFVGARAYTATDTSIANSTATAIPLELERHDTSAFHDLVTNNTRLTVPSGQNGTYAVFGGLAWAANTSGRRIAQIRLNGTTITTSENQGPQAATFPSHSLYDTIALVAGDYIELVGFQSSGGALTILGNTTDAGSTYLGLHKLG